MYGVRLDMSFEAEFIERIPETAVRYEGRGWDDVVRKILRESTDIKLMEDIPRRQHPDLDELPERIEGLPPIEVETDALAYYTPSSSPGSISYRTLKIACEADRTLLGAVKVLPQWESQLLASVDVFRYCFANAIRLHELFHYFTERASRFLGDKQNYYSVYNQNVYAVRKNTVGNLEEALADAYGIGLNKIEFPKDEKSFRMCRSIKPLAKRSWPYWRYTEFLTRLVSSAMLSHNRPPGYREARLYVDEIGLLFRQKDLLNNLYDAMRGFTWFMDELLSGEPRKFDDYNQLTRHPYSDKQFTLFLENYRQWKSNSWFEQLLPWPDEKIEVTSTVHVENLAL